MTNYSLAPAIKQPSIIPYIIQGNDIVPAVLKDIEHIVDTEFRGNKNLKVLKDRNVNKTLIAVGSNTLVLPVVQRVFSNYRVGRPEDIQKTLNDGDTLSIKGNNYVDMGFALDFTGRHHAMALDFYNQLPPELQKLESFPSVVIGYGLKNLENTSYGLGFTYTPESTQVRPASILSQKTGTFRNEDVSLETGLPSKIGEGTRTIFTSTQREHSIDNLGISWFCLDSSLSVGADGDSLAGSGDVGRVVLF